MHPNGRLGRLLRSLLTWLHLQTWFALSSQRFGVSKTMLASTLYLKSVCTTSHALGNIHRSRFSANAQKLLINCTLHWFDMCTVRFIAMRFQRQLVCMVCTQANTGIIAHSMLQQAIKGLHGSSPCIFKLPLDFYISAASQFIRQMLQKFRDVKTKPDHIKTQVTASIHRMMSSCSCNSVFMVFYFVCKKRLTKIRRPHISITHINNSATARTSAVNCCLERLLLPNGM